MTPTQSSRCDSPSLKVALAFALLRFNKLHRPPSSPPDAQRWKRKAKDRKREILRLREELKQLEDGRTNEADLPIASCRCHFFDGIGELGGDGGERGDGGHWIDEVLRRRFLRLVRWKERRKEVDRPLDRRHFLPFDNANETEQLGISIDFLVKLTDNILVKEEIDPSFATFSHQAIDFIVAGKGILEKAHAVWEEPILDTQRHNRIYCVFENFDLYGWLHASLKNLLTSQKEIELIEDIINRLIMRLLRRLSAILETDGSMNCASDPGFYVQHLIRKLGSEPFIGQRILLSVSQKTSIVVENLLFMDPFDDSFPCHHRSMFMMIELMEFLISDYARSWISTEDFDTRLLEEWVRSVIQARKASEMLESRNGLYTLYMERVIGELAKILSPLAREGKLDLDILSYIF